VSFFAFGLTHDGQMLTNEVLGYCSAKFRKGISGTCMGENGQFILLTLKFSIRRRPNYFCQGQNRNMDGNDGIFGNLLH
jgi:hypothetical protein